MTAFQQIDNAADTLDRPHDALLLQDIANNGEAAKEKRLRRASVTWDVRDPPIICGGYRWSSPDRGLCRVVMPFIWERTSMDVTQITIKPRHTVVGGSITVGVVALPYSLQAFPRVIPADAASSSEGTRAAAAVTNTNGLAVDVSDIDTQTVMVLLTWQSTLVGDASSVIAATAMNIPNIEANGSALTSGGLSNGRPCATIAYDDKTNFYTDGDVPAPRQIIFVDNNGAEQDSYVWVYPPHNETGTTWPAVGAGNLEFKHQQLSSAALYSVEIVETAVRASPSYRSSLNPGQPNRARNIRRACYRRAERILLEHTPAWAIGPPTPDPDFTDTNYSATLMQNPVLPVVRFDQPDKSLGTCYVGARHRYDRPDGTDRLISGYRVQAIVAIAASGGYSDAATIAPEEMRLWLTLGDPGGGGAGITGTKRSFQVRPMVYSGSVTNQRHYTNPLGYLMRLHYAASASPSVAYPNSGMIAHALVGVWPEDVWQYGRPHAERGSFVLYDDVITDTDNSANRKLNLWIDTTRSPDPQIWAHCLAWCVTTVQAQNYTEVDAFAVSA